MKKIKEELHLIILWNEDHLGEVEDTINKRFKVIRKISIPPLDKEFGKEKRLEVLNVIYRFEIPIQNLISISKGTNPMVVFVILDENPIYEFKQTSRQLKYFNKSLFELKQELKKRENPDYHGAGSDSTTDGVDPIPTHTSMQYHGRHSEEMTHDLEQAPEAEESTTPLSASAKQRMRSGGTKHRMKIPFTAKLMKTERNRDRRSRISKSPRRFFNHIHDPDDKEGT